MMKYLQKIGKSLMLPVAVLPAAAVLMGIGYWIDPAGWGANSPVAAFLIKAGAAIIDNMSILFAVAIAYGMTKEKDGSAALSGLVAFLVVTTLLSPGSIAALTKVAPEEVPLAFSKISNQFIGILSGLVAATMFNKFHRTELPQALAFFSGKRLVPIMTSIAMLLVSVVLFFVWPAIFAGLVGFGIVMTKMGAFGAAVYGFFNRLLIPVGLHHALNAVFWFDLAGINDIGNFWAGTGIKGVTGMYQAGFFPVMMFGLPAAALAMYHTAKKEKKAAVYGLLLAASFSAFFSGVTEPLEFAFMFLAPGLYVLHAGLTGISMAVCAMLPTRAGFNFSAGFVDWFLSFKAPMAENPLMLLPIGLVFAVLYYVTFRFAITKFNLKTPGREDDDEVILKESVATSNNDYAVTAELILKGLGGSENITSIDNCITRLRLEVKDQSLVDEKLIKLAGVAGVIRPGKTSVQVIIGTHVQFVADEFKKLCG